MSSGYITLVEHLPHHSRVEVLSSQPPLAPKNRRVNDEKIVLRLPFLVPKFVLNY